MEVTKQNTEEKLKIIGMHCATCELTISKSLSSIKDVELLSISFNTGEAKLRIINNNKLKEVVRAIKKAGYDVALEQIKVKLDVEPEEVDKVTKFLESIRGIVEVKNNLNGIFIIEYNPFSIGSNEIIENLKNMGYNPNIIEKEISLENLMKKEWRGIIAQLLIGVIFSPFVVLFQINNNYLLSFLFSLPVMYYSGSRFYMGAIRAIRNRTGNMDLLVFLSSFTAWVYSLISIFTGGEVFFDASVLLITFILIGKTLDLYLRRKVSISVKLLSKLKARKLDGKEIDAEQLKVGDLILVKAGETIPCDGIVEEGEGEVNEGILTGESIPVRKSKGNAVLGGSVLISGYVVIYPTRVGERTFISQVIKSTTEAISVKLPIQEIVNRVAGVFVPIVILISILTFFIWYLAFNVPIERALLFSIAVIAVACPCALGLATPLAVLATVNRALRRGIIIRRGEVLEKLRKANAIIFDKTGTLTKGEISVKNFKEWIKDSIKFAASLESLSSHPIAKAISSLIPEGEKLKVDKYEEFIGFGVYGEINGNRILVGKPDFVKSNCEGEFPEDGDVLVCMNNKPAASIFLYDPLREGVNELIDFLSKKGFRIIIATGSGKGIEGLESYTNLTPEDKVELVRKIKREGFNVIFVGDGVNDAQAIAEADVGVAINFGSDIAKIAGDIIIKDISQIKELIFISNYAVRKIKQNLSWAFGYNALLIPIAAGIFYPSLYLSPELSALFMAFSSVFVTVWSMLT
jgi:Cu2+-exporting ATPase